MIDPFTALAAVSAAVKLVKATVATVHDVESLGPVLGKYFSAKSDAIAVVKHAQKGGFSGSAKAQAIELEMAIEGARVFEEQVKMLFFSSNKMDVWQKIVARTAQIERDHSIAEGKRKAAAKKRQREIDETVTLLLVMFVVVAVLGVVGWFVWEALAQCQGRCAINK
ncbi:hypothetical protein UFOVP1356_21 [uncultured Caudovirales phage]|uniref:Uncharacterized protein n=1 Tax=uncultured Caudovirales phage TaxID=2100421 RepID=A0A6J5RSB3_9CAUD|nr:hypothetical protein UFOVP1356_21 [uncultured Caudovirales phage]